MRLNTNQLILIVAVLAVGTFLFVKGFKTPEASNASQEAGQQAASIFSFGDYLKNAKGTLSEEKRTRLASLEQQTGDNAALQQMIVLWDSANYPLIAAHYAEQVAEKEPTEANWFNAGGKYYMVAATSSDSLVANEAATDAKHALEKVISINPNNLEAKNALAACYIEVDQEIMKGVGLLKEVEAKDSNNVQAIYTLGTLSIRSGQYDKALPRFEKLTRLQPFNAEYYFYLGEVQARLGNTKDAIRTYEKCKTLLKDNEAKKEVASIINKLKNI